MKPAAPSMLRLAIATLIVGMLLCVPAGAQWFHKYDGVTRSLPLDLTKIMIQWKESARIVWRFDDMGLPQSAVEAHGIPGWSVVHLPQPMQNQGAITRLIKRLTTRNEVQFVTPVFLDPAGGPVFPSSTIIVQFADYVPLQKRRHAIDQYGSLLETSWGGLSHTYALASPSKNGGQVLKDALALSSIRGVNYAEPDFCYTVSSASRPNDPEFGSQWAVNISQDVFDPVVPQRLLQRADSDLDMIETFDITRGSSNIKIAILDDGVQMDHPDLPNSIPGFDSTPDAGHGQPIGPLDNHGTGIAGIISARPNNGRGIAGAAPDAQLVSVRCYMTMPGTLITMTSWTVDALKWCEIENIHITNNSVLFSFLTNAVKNKYDSTAANGMMHFGSAGNTAGPTNQYPAKYASVHGLMGITGLGSQWIHSATGSDMAYGGPAAEVESTDRSGSAGIAPGNHAPLSGTSYATAYASAIAGLILSINPSLTSAQVHGIMESTAKDLGLPGFDPVYNAGFLNAYAAVFQAALSLPDPSKYLFYQAGTQNDDHYGASASAIGDLDGDGILEFAVGAPRFDGFAGADVGQVKFFSGTSGKLITTMEGTTIGEEFGHAIQPLPDMNGDNVLEFAIASPRAKLGPLSSAGRVTVYSGSTMSALYTVGGTTSGARFGTAMATLSDIDGDSFDELVVSSPGKTVNGSNNVGAIDVYSGKTGAHLYTVDGLSSVERDFGFALLRLEDQNADGFDDIMVGSPRAFANGSNAGRIIAISGQTGARLSHRDGVSPGDRSGYSLATWIDHNLDGFREVVVGSPGFHGPPGPASGIVTIHSGQVATYPLQGLFFLGENAGDEFGTTLVDGLDIDGDRFEDILIGAPGYDGQSTDIGKIYSYTAGGGARPRFELTGRAAHQRFGTSIKPLLDIDGDGAGEFVIGAAGSAANAVPGFSVVICAPNPANLPPHDEDIMRGSLGSEESGPYDVFFINSSSGGLNRTVHVGAFQDVRYEMQVPRANKTGKAEFSLHAYLGVPQPKWQVDLPGRMGRALWTPCTINPLASAGFLLADSNPQPLCPPRFYPEKAPNYVLDSVGLPSGTTVTVFGLVDELPGMLPKVTNAIVLKVN